MRWHGGALMIVLALTACTPVVVPIVDGEPEGPQLAIEVINASNQESEVGYEFEAVQSSGGGEGTVGRCEQVVVPFGLIGGRYSILLDGEALIEGAVPPGLPADAWVVVRVEIGPDGEGEVIGPRVVARMPNPQPRRIGDCG